VTYLNFRGGERDGCESYRLVTGPGTNPQTGGRTRLLQFISGGEEKPEVRSEPQRGRGKEGMEGGGEGQALGTRRMIMKKVTNSIGLCTVLGLKKSRQEERRKG